VHKEELIEYNIDLIRNCISLVHPFFFLRTIDHKRIINFYLNEIHKDQNSVLKMHLLLELEIEHISKVPDLTKEKEIFLKMLENTKKIIVI
jgi:hypothetical protein